MESVCYATAAYRVSSGDRNLWRLWELLALSPFTLPGTGTGVGRTVRLLNQCLLQRELNQLMPKGRLRVVCYDSPSQCELVRLIHGDLSVYLAIDDRTLTVAGVPIKGELEAERSFWRGWIRSFASAKPSQKLCVRACPYPSKPVHVLRNGYDERLFDPQRNYHEPHALKGIPRPRILVSGHISDRIDWNGICGASLLRPEWTWIILGPTDQGIKEKTL